MKPSLLEVAIVLSMVITSLAVIYSLRTVMQMAGCS